jgi:hypothetical protein
MMAGILPPNHLHDFISQFVVKAKTFVLVLIVIMYKVITVGSMLEPPGCTAVLLLLLPPQSPPSLITTTAVMNVRTGGSDTVGSMHFGWKFSHEKRWLDMP